VYPKDTLQRVKTLPAFSPVIPAENLIQKINCDYFVARKVLSFLPKQSAQDSMESMLKSKPASPTKCTFNGVDASAFYR
jgi:hypothetical protein